ncbi:MAG: N-6 DNA methylase [Bacteroidales bacterium]|nr:N-6 DNA methylase [Bacteroidales bacterium]
MSLFQKSVEKKYLGELDSTLIDQKYADFQEYFANPERQENIRHSKEEQFQEGFLRELFVKIFGYTLNPEPNFNLTTELKNIANSKKADGAILKGEDAFAVIELKGTDTTDLDKVEIQAFGYKNHHPKCVYVITSNFEKLRFYIQNAVDHIDFDLFNLTKEQFSLMWLCLAKDNLINDLPLKIKDSSVLQEENITKQLYADYSSFRKAIYNNLIKNNPETDKLLLFKKTQKLLDRFLFIFFAEDRLLVPPNSISQIIEKWKDDVDFGEDKPLYSIFKQYFHVLNVGRPKSGKRQEIFAYNGGLFKPDELLDTVSIDDDILHEYTMKLTRYDFETDVDVNILGHIFEHSLGEIENVQAEIKGEKVETQKTKRKKDGIFYTPKYITKYIVENTVGKLCEEKQTELDIVDEEYAKGRKNRKKDTIKSLDTKLTTYREWLLTLTILDPACGSGAFLNQALEFLITEHKKIDGLRAQLFGGAIIFSDITADILEKNIYGVDLNEESVEIAKLSLWLRTAQKGRKLNTLSNNIKCGNSLIDDPEVAGEKAFNWQNEFPEIFAKGGFDVVIGNPPYVSSKGETIDEHIKQHLTKSYSTAAYQIDLYILFLERALRLVNSIGIISFIVPNTWLNNLLLEPVRKFLLENSRFEEFISMPANTFENASVDTIITTYCLGDSNSRVRLLKCNNSEFSNIGLSNQNDWSKNKDASINIHVTKDITQIIKKAEKESILFGEISNIVRGVGVYHKRVGHTKEFIDSDPFQSESKKDNTFVPYLRGRNLSQWLVDWTGDSFISYGEWLAEPRKPEFFVDDRILVRKILSDGIVATHIKEQFVVDQQLYTAILNEDSNFQYLDILAILCSKFMSFYFRYKYSEFDDLFPQIKLNHVKCLPISKGITRGSNKLSTLSSLRLNSTIECNSIRLNLLKLLKSKFDIKKPTSKLSNWIELDFKEFLIELKKAKIKLDLSDEAEWMQYLNEQKEKAQTLKSEIEKTDKEIDQMVYELYGLSEEEIKIAENA